MKIVTKVFFLTCVMLSLSGCNYIFPSTWNYRITVEIETPEGVKTGSAVRQVKAQLQLPLNPDIGDIVHTVYGEAVAIDLGKRGIVFALIDWDSYYEVYKAFPTNAKTSADKLKFYRNLRTGSKGALLKKRPKMVVYEDEKSPETSEIVYLQQHNKTVDKFEEIFGKGVSLKSVTIVITDEAITFGVVDELMPIFDNRKYSIKKSNYKKEF